MKRSTSLILLPAITIATLAIASKAFLSQLLLLKQGQGRTWITRAKGRGGASASTETNREAMMPSSLFGGDNSDHTNDAARNLNVHFIILVHGWMGNSKEMGYLQKAIEKETNIWQTKQDPGGGNHRFVVHSAVTNDGRTYDGIAAGGQRLADEITSFVNNVSDLLSVDGEEGDPTTEFTLSFVGNSLGGLYARYALSKIPFLRNDGDGDGGSGPSTIPITVRPKIFCTTATPHLGVSQHTYLPLPRSLEYVVGNAMLPTGRDLFRITDVIDRITVDPQFVKPLKLFHKRIAYANTHATDFQVPTSTAAFLAESSSSVHRKLPTTGNDNHRPLVSLAVETEKLPSQQTEALAVADKENGDGNNDNKRMTSAQIAERLDSLGWHKVFCDVRESLLSVPIPFKKSNNNNKNTTHHKDEYTSKELLHRYAGGILSSNRFHFPFGHTVLVANSKNKQYEKWNAAGRPIMDHLAANLVRDIMTD